MNRIANALGVVLVVASSLSAQESPNRNQAIVRQLVDQGPEVQAEAISIALDVLKEHNQRLGNIEKTVAENSAQITKHNEWIERLKSQLEEFKKPGTASVAPLADQTKVPVTLTSSSKPQFTANEEVIGEFEFRNQPVLLIHSRSDRSLTLHVNGRKQALASVRDTCEHCEEVGASRFGRVYFQQCKNRYLIVSASSSK